MVNGREDASRLSSLIDLRAQKLRLDLQAARLFVGTVDVGNVAENAVRRFLQSSLPARYSIGVGEVIGPDGQSPRRVEQTQQKDVLIHDPYGCAILGWDDSGISLFPVESIYAVIEVKACLSGTDELLWAVDQTLEVKKLCLAHRGQGTAAPFTAVFVFESRVKGDTLFDALKSRQPDERADFVFVLSPKPRDVSCPDNSFCFVHWHYYSRGGGPVRLVSSDDVALEQRSSPDNRDKYLTFCETDKALLWFYLFLTEQLDRIHLARPNLLAYAQADRQRLGWRSNE